MAGCELRGGGQGEGEVDGVNQGVSVSQSLASLTGLDEEKRKKKQKLYRGTGMRSRSSKLI